MDQRELVEVALSLQLCRVQRRAQQLWCAACDERRFGAGRTRTEIDSKISWIAEVDFVRVEGMSLRPNVSCLWQGFGEHPHRDMEIMTFIVDGYLTHKDVRLIWGFYHTLQGLVRESHWKMSGLHGNRRDIGPWQLSIYDFRRENQIQTSLSTWYPLYSFVWVW